MRRAGPALLAVGALAVGLAACGDDGDDGGGSSPTQPPTTQAPTPTAEQQATDEPAAHADEDKPSTGDDNGHGTAHQPSADERAVARSVRRYVSAIDDRDGDALCALLVPGAIDEVELPKDRGSCAASLAASIGYRDPRGLPVWKTARVAELRSVEVTGDSAKVIVTTVTRFADRAEVSVEDDVVYLQRSGEDWLIAKPSSTLYRAVGIADVPPSVLSPPA
jgi:hypothetical protein